MDIAEMGDSMDETGEQMEFEAESSKTREHTKEGSLLDRKRMGSSEESLTDKAREFIAKNKNRNLAGGGGFSALVQKTLLRTLLPPPLHPL